MNPRLKALLDLWPQIVAGYHKSSDHVWQFVGEYNVLSEDAEWWLKHEGYCHPNLYFGPFDCLFSLMEWEGEDLRQETLDICRDELNLSLDPEIDRDMPPEHWEKLIEKLENL